MTFLTKFAGPGRSVGPRAAVIGHAARNRECILRSLGWLGAAAVMFDTLEDFRADVCSGEDYDMVVLAGLHLPGDPYLRDHHVARALLGPSKPLLMAVHQEDFCKMLASQRIAVDDIFISPFSQHEATVTMRHFMDVHRLSSAQGVPVLEWGKYRFEPRRNAVRIGAQDIRLSSGEFELALELFLNSDGVLPRRHLKAVARDISERDDDEISLGTTMTSLRLKLGLRGEHGWSLQNVPFRGYAVRPVNSAFLAHWGVCAFTSRMADLWHGRSAHFRRRRVTMLAG